MRFGSRSILLVVNDLERGIAPRIWRWRLLIELARFSWLWRTLRCNADEPARSSAAPSRDWGRGRNCSALRVEPTGGLPSESSVQYRPSGWLAVRRYRHRLRLNGPPRDAGIVIHAAGRRSDDAHGKPAALIDWHFLLHPKRMGVRGHFPSFDDLAVDSVTRCGPAESCCGTLRPNTARSGCRKADRARRGRTPYRE